MKMKFIALTIIASLCITSCGDSCDNFDENVIGTWNSPNIGIETFSFESGGILDDANDALIPSLIDSVTVDTKKWSTSGDTLLTIRAEAGTAVVESQLSIVSFDCDIITLEQQGNTFVLNRQ